MVYPYRKKEAKYCSHKCYARTVHLQPKTEKWYEVMKGRKPWNKGLKGWAKGTKAGFQEGISLIPWNKGKKLSEEHIQKLCGPRVNARKRPNERVTPKDRLERLRFRNEMQKKVFERDNYTCQLCREKGGHLQVDHIQPWAEYVEGRFSMDNCRTLCMDCHYKITFGRPKPKDIVWGHNLRKVVLN